jgi:hypothetical protein
MGDGPRLFRSVSSLLKHIGDILKEDDLVREIGTDYSAILQIFILSVPAYCRLIKHTHLSGIQSIIIIIIIIIII